MKKLIILAGTLCSFSFLMSGPTFATEDTTFPRKNTTRGFFVGINAGSSKIDLNEITNFSNGKRADFPHQKKTKSNAFTFGIDAGYMFNKYIGVQFSLNKYQQISASFDEHGLTYAEYQGLYSNDLGFEINGNQETIDSSNRYKSYPYVPALSLLLTRPINEKWAIYGQAGVTLTAVDYETTKKINKITVLDNKPTKTSDKPSTAKYRKTKLVPQLGVGLKYSINEHLALSINYNWTTVPITNQFGTKDQNALSYYNMGLTYTF